MVGTLQVQAWHPDDRARRSAGEAPRCSRLGFPDCVSNSETPPPVKTWEAMYIQLNRVGLHLLKLIPMPPEALRRYTYSKILGHQVGLRDTFDGRRNSKFRSDRMSIVGDAHEYF